MPIGRSFVVVKKDQRGMIMTVVATFDVHDKAQEWADNANEWYGPLHPLTPLVVVGDVLIEPRLFPVEAMRKVALAEEEATSKAALAELFSDIDED